MDLTELLLIPCDRAWGLYSKQSVYVHVIDNVCHFKRKKCSNFATGDFHFPIGLDVHLLLRQIYSNLANPQYSITKEEQTVLRATLYFAM